MLPANDLSFVTIDLCSYSHKSTYSEIGWSGNLSTAVEGALSKEVKEGQQ